jgi:hypothetical protein
MRHLIPVSWAVAGAALCYGLWSAFVNSWLCDDAFISYRYAENFVDGLGLVYNAGERVEGYTNFLWVMLLSLGLLVDVDPLLGSQYLGVGFYLATIVLLCWTAAGGNPRRNIVPLAAIGLCLHGHSAIFATCGLETSMFTFFVTAGLVLLVYAERPGHFAMCGLALIVATMTRPDGAVFYACASVVVAGLAARRRRWGTLIGFGLPFVVVYGPYFLWKFSYYGYPFPNTFYAKSASDPYLGQGLWYVWLYFSCYWYLIPALVIPAWLSLRRGGTATAGLPGRRGPVVVALFTLPFLAYVVWVGGDFMFSRFCLPVTPALLLGLQYLAHRRLLAAVSGVVLVLGSILTTHGPVSVYLAYTARAIAPGNARNVVEERDHYPHWYVEAYQILGETLTRRCHGVDLRVAIGGGQAMLGYFGRFSHVLEIHGLTDTFIAHREISTRGRLGHEKELPLDHEYYRERGIHLIVGAYTQHAVPGDSPRMAEARRFEFWADDVPFYPDGERHSGFAQATMLIYDAEWMNRLVGRPGVRFTPFPEFLDHYLPTMGGLGQDAVRRDLAAFRRFYFDHVDDRVRLRMIEAFLE